jgi:hypothetical protein
MAIAKTIARRTNSMNRTDAFLRYDGKPCRISGSFQNERSRISSVCQRNS